MWVAVRPQEVLQVGCQYLEVKMAANAEAVSSFAKISPAKKPIQCGLTRKLNILKFFFGKN
jgi:hypothetical protein